MLLGLGLSIDYSRLVVTRWREERAAGRATRGRAHGGQARRAFRLVQRHVASLGLFALT